jgi:hypothetical protein
VISEVSYTSRKRRTCHERKLSYAIEVSIHTLSWLTNIVYLSLRCTKFAAVVLLACSVHVSRIHSICLTDSPANRTREMPFVPRLTMPSTSALVCLALAASPPNSTLMRTTHVAHVFGFLTQLTRPLTRLLNTMWETSVRFAFGNRPPPMDEEASTIPLLSDNEPAPTQPIFMTNHSPPRLPNDHQETRDLPNPDEDWDPDLEPLLGYSSAELALHTNVSFANIDTTTDSPSLTSITENMGGSLTSRRTPSQIGFLRRRQQLRRQAVKIAHKATNGGQDISSLLQSAQEHADLEKAIALSQTAQTSHLVTSSHPVAPDDALPSQEQMDLEKTIALSVADQLPDMDTVRQRSSSILSQNSQQSAKSRECSLPVGSIQQPKSGEPFHVLDPQKVVALKLLLNPVHDHLLKLKATTPESLPAYHPSIKAKCYMQILKTRLLPIGACIVKFLSHVPENKRGALELDVW